MQNDSFFTCKDVGEKTWAILSIKSGAIKKIKQKYNINIYIAKSKHD